MIFKNQAESASLLANKIAAENLSEYILYFINPDSQEFASLVATSLKTTALYLPDSLHHLPQTKAILIIDSGDTRASEYNEYADLIHHTLSKTKIIIAVPVIPQAEESIFKANCDSLVTLHVEPLFFSMSQFYPQNSI